MSPLPRRPSASTPSLSVFSHRRRQRTFPALPAEKRASRKRACACSSVPSLVPTLLLPPPPRRHPLSTPSFPCPRHPFPPLRLLSSPLPLPHSLTREARQPPQFPRVSLLAAAPVTPNPAATNHPNHCYPWTARGGGIVWGVKTSNLANTNPLNV